MAPFDIREVRELMEGNKQELEIQQPSQSLPMDNQGATA